MKNLVAVAVSAAMAAVFLQGAADTADATGPAAPDVGERVRAARGHPRLFWPAGGEDAVRALVRADPAMASAAESVGLCADHMLKEAPVVYRKEGRRLLHRSREVLTRVLHLAFQARMTGDRRYVDRAAKEMLAAAAMPDWNPSHFLDTAEMTLALAVGYDWLHKDLDPAVRATVREAIESKGLGPYLKPGSRHGWEKGGNNWNQVCHAGMMAGALALLEDDPARAAAVVARALEGLPHAMKVYDPDGSYPEGPGYWGYGTTFNVMGIAMLESALGTDFGLAAARGYLKTGDFMVQTAGPSLDWYAFSDCGRGGGFSPAMFWLAGRAQRPDWLWFEMPRFERDVAEVRAQAGGSAADRLFPLALVWARPGMKAREPAAYATVLNGQNPLGFYRTSWTDPRALYLAIKAGTPSASHGHMDVGSFILEADGVRWALDLGMQGYHAMEARGLNIWDGSPGSDRWRIFRYHNRAHNTLTVDGMEQVVRGRAAFDAAATDPRQGRFRLVLDGLYKGQLQVATRTFAAGRETGVAIEDRVRGSEKDRQVRWTLVTPGTLKAEGDRAGWLEKDGQRLRIEVKSDVPVRLQCAPAKGPNDFDEPNPGANLVTFDVPVPAGKDATWTVTLVPGSVWKAGK